MPDFIAGFFHANQVIVLAIYGQTFFTLGLSVALQWHRESRLELARALPLLAAFGFGSSAFIWADVFIPVQAAYVAPQVVALLRIGQLLIIIASFACLLHFGIHLNWRQRWAAWVPWMLAAGVVLLVFWLGARGVPVEQIRIRAEQIVRPLLILPGALLAAWGLRGQARRISAMGLPPHIVSWLRVAGVTLGFYAFAGGLLVPLWPDGRTLLDRATGVPAAVPRAIAGGLLAFAMIRALAIFRVELHRLVQAMGREQALAADRQRIGRDLHDGTIQAIYGAGLMLDSIAHTLPHDPDLAGQQLQQVMTSLNTTIQDIRRYIHNLPEAGDDLTQALAELASEHRAAGRLDVTYRIEGRLPRLAPHVRAHLLQMVREGLTNARKHSGASRVDLLLRAESEGLRVVIADNGRGLPAGGAFRPGGRGIPNLYARARLLGGQVDLRSSLGVGTTLEIEVPYTSLATSGDAATSELDAVADRSLEKTPRVRA